MLEQGAVTEFGTCPNKAESRAEIVKRYEFTFGRDSLPRGQQYWTLCGEMAGPQGLQPRCEMLHMLELGFITPDQFRGVEGNAAIHAANVRACPRRDVRLIHDDIVHALQVEKRLCPGLINLDTVNEPANAARLFTSTLQAVHHTSGDCLIVLNTVLRSPHSGRVHEIGDLAQAILRSGVACSLIEAGGWVNDVTAPTYPGTGKRSRTEMGMMFFYRFESEAKKQAA